MGLHRWHIYDIYYLIYAAFGHEALLPKLFFFITSLFSSSQKTISLPSKLVYTLIYAETYANGFGPLDTRTLSSWKSVAWPAAVWGSLAASLKAFNIIFRENSVLYAKGRTESSINLLEISPSAGPNFLARKTFQAMPRHRLMTANLF